MTENEQMEVFKLVKSLFPGSTAELAMLLVKNADKHPYSTVSLAIQTHAETEMENRLSIPWVMNEVERLVFFKTAGEKHQAASDEFIARRQREWMEKTASEKSVAAALAFCESHLERLDEWRAEIVAIQPTLGMLTEKKKTLESTALVCAIYSRFGKIPVECGL